VARRSIARLHGAIATSRIPRAWTIKNSARDAQSDATWRRDLAASAGPDKKGQAGKPACPFAAALPQSQLRPCLTACCFS
jgi:hypothetical protein